MLASIIINNYNYGNFLDYAVDSALAQTYRGVEVVVVDDGSTDGSRGVIGRYSGRVVPVLKTNGGQTSALNAGLCASRGDLVCFLDADDSLLPGAIENAAGCFEDPRVVKAHWPLWVMDEDGRRSDQTLPGRMLSRGELREAILTHGPDGLCWPPTSGNLWRRDFLDRIFPLPEVEAEFRSGSASADACMSVLAPLYGAICRLPEPQGCYRLHGRNDYALLDGRDKIDRDLRTHDHLCSVLDNACRAMGLDVDAREWKRKSWVHRLHRCVEAIPKLIGAEEPFLFVDEDQLRGSLHAGMRAIPYPEHGGQYWGPPPDDEAAVRELERVRSLGVGWLVLAWPAFWWLDHYPGFRRHLDVNYRCVERNDIIVVFDLRNGPIPTSPTVGMAGRVEPGWTQPGEISPS
jgi:glycosyltransferase involved in cell wall biosynthesis